MLEKLKQDVYKANIDLVKAGLVLLTWGNVSGYDAQTGYVVIKPSGIGYDKMTPADMVVVDVDGHVIEGDLNPSSDTPTHLEIYRAFSGIFAVCHTHSKWATAYAQACKDIPCLGTTQADHFFGDIPCTRRLKKDEIDTDYEKNMGKVIVETFLKRNINPLDISGAIVANHGPFTWGSSLQKAVENSVVLEYVAHMDYIAKHLNESADMQKELIDKHYLRKHGSDAYYGQK
jgi:L-ribulose-5-phosphate 4-epimerase